MRKVAILFAVVCLGMGCTELKKDQSLDSSVTAAGEGGLEPDAGRAPAPQGGSGGRQLRIGGSRLRWNVERR